MKYFCWILILGVSVLSCGCSYIKKSSIEEFPSEKFASDNELLDESALTSLQREYLENEKGYHFEDSDIYNYTYEETNYLLLGTGLELYNPTSGVEKNGIYYETTNADFYKNPVCESKEKITFEKLYNIRLKDVNIRLEDFMEYEYEFTAHKDGSYTLDLDISDTVGMLRVRYTIDGNTVHISSMLIDETYSILYDRYLYEYNWQNGVTKLPSDTGEIKNLLGGVYGTQTADSVDIIIWQNESGRTYTDSYALYEGEDCQGRLVSQSDENDVIQYPAYYGWRLHKVIFKNGGITEPGTYTLVYGENDLVYTFEYPCELVISDN